MPTVIETFPEWSARQGGSPIRVGTTLYFPNGSTCRAEDGDFRTEPQADELLTLKNRRKYHAARLERMEHDFHALQAALMGKGPIFSWPERWYGVGTGDGLKDLETIRQAVIKERAAIIVVEDAIANTPEGKQKARAARVAAEQEQRALSEAAALAGRAAAIRI